MQLCHYHKKKLRIIFLYADIAVSAPYEEPNGVVYIFYGSQRGLNPSPRQIIKSPSRERQFFGHSISRSVDIDGNQFDDIAIGAPNTDLVYIYKSYPTIKITANIYSNLSQITVNTSSVQINVCLLYRSKVKIDIKVRVKVTLHLDHHHKRAFFDDGTDTREYVKEIATVEFCQNYTITLTNLFHAIYKPIKLQMYYEIENNFENHTDFCTTCVLVDPDVEKLVENEIPIATGCVSEICVADLSIIGFIHNYS